MPRLQASVLLLLLCLVALATAWSPEDHEIFRLQDEVAQHEGSNATFYSFLGVKPFASIDDVNAAYKKKARTLHPDKARQNFIATYGAAPPVQKEAKKGEKPTVHVHKNKKPTQKEINAFNKEASARFARLGIVTNILRGAERKRYDHFLRNGFPKWRGTGYYYQRFRPGLGSVLLGLFVFIGGGVHYVTLYMGYKRQREFVERYIHHARRMAWGDDTNNIAGLGNAPAPVAESTEDDEPAAMNWNRKEKRARERENKRAAKKPATKSNKNTIADESKPSGVDTPVEPEVGGGPVGAKKRTMAKNGKILIVDSVGDVYLEEQTAEGEIHEFLLDVDEIHIPTIHDTFLFRLPIYVYNQSIGKFLAKQTSDAELEGLLDGTPETDGLDEATSTLKTAAQPNANAESRKRKIKPNRR